MGPESAVPAEALGVLPPLVAFGELDGEVVGSAAGVAVGVPAAEGDALGAALDGAALGVPDGAAVAEEPEAEAVADAKGDRDGVGAAVEPDFPHPHQGNETVRHPPDPLPLAWAIEGTTTAPAATTTAAAPAIFRRFDFWRCLDMRGLIQVVRYSAANSTAKR
ncbi:hypothetical protein [Streptomyces sp. T028]|uniref:hypothetical protein n=1 Tax=Streptomyces sp. T028 TaxID=3394379 RepID=UPI003A870B27